MGIRKGGPCIWKVNKLKIEMQNQDWKFWKKIGMPFNQKNNNYAGYSLFYDIHRENKNIPKEKRGKP